MRLLPLRPALALAFALPFGGACVGPGAAPPPDDNAPKRTTFSFAPIETDGVDARWGAAAVGDFVVGGVDQSMTVTQDIFRLDASDGTMRATPLTTLDTPRYCNCAMFDPNRHELLVVGGRNGTFNDENSAEIVNTETLEHVAIDANGAADHPVGCQAFFSPSADKGYVFGGLDSSSGFTGKTWRYDPAAHTLTELSIDGPPARYDAGIHIFDDGTVLLVGGMGLGAFGPIFFSDLWRFDPADETWSQIATTSTDVPQGRRYPWTSLAPDESMLLYGFGSDSGNGSHVLGDLWSFTFDTGAWAQVPVDGERPEARGFTYNWRGPPGSAGALAFGTDANLGVFEDAYALQVPDALAGTWH